jgi:hypothetical protein
MVSESEWHASGSSLAGVQNGNIGDLHLTVQLDSTKARAGENIPDSIDSAPVKFIRSGPFVKQ